MSKYVWHRRNDDEIYYISPTGKIVASIISNGYLIASIENSDWSEKYLNVDLAKKAIEDKLESFKTNDRNALIAIFSIMAYVIFKSWDNLSLFFNRMWDF